MMGSVLSLRLAIVVLLLAACGASTHTVTVSNERIGRPAGPNAAMYFDVASNGADRLIGASTSVASSVRIHETILDDHGATGMHPLDFLEVGDGEGLVLEPGGFHLMLMNVDRLEVGDAVAVVLHWDVAGDMVVEAKVVAPEDALGS